MYIIKSKVIAISLNVYITDHHSVYIYPHMFKEQIWWGRFNLALTKFRQGEWINPAEKVLVW